MFRVTFYVDTRRLGEALEALQGLARGMPEVVPVANAEAKNGALKARTNGAASDMLVDWIRKQHLKEVRPVDAQKFLRSIGRSPQSASYTLNEVISKHKALRKTGKGIKTVYTVLPAKGSK